MIKGIILDYGGTLDTAGNHWSEVIWEAYQKNDVSLDKALFREAYVEGERELARTLHIMPHHDFHDLLSIKINIELQWLASHGHFNPEEIADKSAAIARDCYQSARKSIENATPVLQALSRKFPLVLVSNFYGNINAVLRDFGIDAFFKKVIESAVVGVRKPNPEIFRLGVDALELEPQEVLVIGDSYKKDILPAESIGCKTLWLKGKAWTPEEEAQYHPTIIRNLSETLAFLEN